MTNENSDPNPLIDPLYLEKVITQAEAARLRGVSIDTLKRNSLRGESPQRIRLSPRRVGYRLRDVLKLPMTTT